MRKIPGIIASPRKPGNCEIMVKAVSRHILEEHELRLLRLADFDLRPCKGCYRCLVKEKRCIRKDDLYTVIDAIAWADALVVAVPTYFPGANALLKLLLATILSIVPSACIARMVTSSSGRMPL